MEYEFNHNSVSVGVDVDADYGYYFSVYTTILEQIIEQYRNDGYGDETIVDIITKNISLEFDVWDGSVRINTCAEYGIECIGNISPGDFDDGSGDYLEMVKDFKKDHSQEY